MKVNFLGILTAINKKMNLQENLRQIMQDKNKLILVSFIVLLVFVLDLMFILRPQGRKISSYNIKITKLRNDLKELNLESVVMQEKIDRVAQEEMKELVSSDRMPWIIEELSRMASEQKIRISQIEPVRDSSGSNLPGQPVAQSSAVFFDLDIDAGYHGLASFFEKVENHSVLLQIENLAITYNKEDPFKHRVRLRLKTYEKQE